MHKKIKIFSYNAQKQIRMMKNFKKTGRIGKESQEGFFTNGITYDTLII